MIPSFSEFAVGVVPSPFKPSRRRKVSISFERQGAGDHYERKALYSSSLESGERGSGISFCDEHLAGASAGVVRNPGRCYNKPHSKAALSLFLQTAAR